MWQEVEFLTFRDSLLTKLERCRALCCLDDLASPLIFAERYHVSQGFHHFDHLRNMISEVIRETDELRHFLLSRGLRKVKDFQSLLWGERGAFRGDKVPVTEMR